MLFTVGSEVQLEIWVETAVVEKWVQGFKLPESLSFH